MLENRYLNALIFISALLFSQGASGGHSPYSPVFIVSILLFLMLMLRIFITLKLKKWDVKFFSGLSIIIIITVGHVIVTNTDIQIIYRNILIYLPFLYIRIVNEKYKKMYLNIFWMIFLSELILRFLTGRAFGFYFYNWKDSLLFVDTNFLGIVLLIPLLHKLKYSRSMSAKLAYLITLILTASRTAWITFLYLMLPLKKFLVYGIFAIVSMMFVFSSNFQNFYHIDGSLSTKLEIFSTFLLIANNVEVVLWGIGKTNILEITYELTGVNQAVGHTLFGNITMYGLLMIAAQFMTALTFVTGSRKIFTIVVLLPSITGLTPTVLLPLLVLLVNLYFPHNSPSKARAI